MKKTYTLLRRRAIPPKPINAENINQAAAGNGVVASTGNALLLEELNGTGVAGAGQYNLAINNTWSGINTFNNSVNLSFGAATINGTTTVPSNPLQLYQCSGSGYTINFPAPSASNKGCFVTLRRLTTAAAINIAPTGSTSIVAPAGFTFTIGATISWSTGYTIQFYSDGGSNWIGTFQQ